MMAILVVTVGVVLGLGLLLAVSDALADVRAESRS